jgi:hypothetical protein
MHHKHIKLLVKKQLKKQYPRWKRLTKKEKKKIAKKVIDEVIKLYDFTQPINATTEELLGIEEQVPTLGIMNLDEMAQFIDRFNKSKLIRINSHPRHPSYIQDEELRVIDNLLDDLIINDLLSYRGYTPSMRESFLSTLFRAELLKALKYPEISYRKYCDEDYMGKDRKQNRAFIGLPLNSSKIIDHTQLSKFRSALSFTQMVNLTVYILHHFYQHGLLGECILHGVDSTELANDCRRPLASIKIGGKKVRVYEDIDCDCGTRRNKRDKSVYVIGYRMHTLSVINAKTGHSYPLVSLLAPANHHDSHFIKPLVLLAQAMGIELKLITADEAYNDTDGSLYKETGVHLISPPSSKVKLPEHVNPQTMEVMYDELCEIPMKHIGCSDQDHEFKCGAAPGECPLADKCPQCRFIPIDNGYFQRIPYDSQLVSKALEIRKNAERPFNLLKNREGLEQVRVRTQHALLARCTFTTIATLLLEMAGTRKKQETVSRQMPLYANA